MKNLLFDNTYDSGKVTYLILKEKNKFIGVCLEFDLIVQENTPQETKEQIEDYAHTWLENVATNKLPEELLNKPAPKKYWALYKKLLAEEEKKVETEKEKLVNFRSGNSNVASFQVPYPQFSNYAAP